jgi:hypothetical protein
MPRLVAFRAPSRVFERLTLLRLLARFETQLESIDASCYVAAMTLEERLALAREIAARTKPRFVEDDTRHEARRIRYEEAKRNSARLKQKRKR